ncbi:unnamed protein product, partial [Ectocarpus sp. 8 AP-2014]
MGQQIQLQKPTTGGAGAGAGAGIGMPMARRGKFKAPARLDGGQPKKAGHVSQQREQEQGQLQGQKHDQEKKRGEFRRHRRPLQPSSPSTSLSSSTLSPAVHH